MSSPTGGIYNVAPAVENVMTFLLDKNTRPALIL
jgi:hypothetical protein